MPAWILSAIAWVVGKLFGNPSAPTSAEVVAKDDGMKTQGQADAVQSAKVNAAEAQAVVDAPTSKASVINELNEGKF